MRFLERGCFGALFLVLLSSQSAAHAQEPCSIRIELLRYLTPEELHETGGSRREGQVEFSYRIESRKIVRAVKFEVLMLDSVGERSNARLDAQNPYTRIVENPFAGVGSSLTHMVYVELKAAKYPADLDLISGVRVSVAGVLLEDGSRLMPSGEGSCDATFMVDVASSRMLGYDVEPEHLMTTRKAPPHDETKHLAPLRGSPSGCAVVPLSVEIRGPSLDRAMPIDIEFENSSQKVIRNVFLYVGPATAWDPRMPELLPPFMMTNRRVEPATRSWASDYVSSSVLLGRSGGLIDGDFRVRIKIDSVLFEDGSTWTAEHAESCTRDFTVDISRLGAAGQQ